MRIIFHFIILIILTTVVDVAVYFASNDVKCSYNILILIILNVNVVCRTFFASIQVHVRAFVCIMWTYVSARGCGFINEELNCKRG